MLSRFLSAVDHRDGASASMLISDDCIWDTHTDVYGAVCGVDDVVELIEFWFESVSLLLLFFG